MHYEIAPIVWDWEKQNTVPIPETIDAMLAKVKQVYITPNKFRKDRPCMIILFDDQKLPREPEKKLAACKEIYAELMNTLLAEYRVNPVGTLGSLPFNTMTDALFPKVENLMPLPRYGTEDGMQPDQFPRLPFAIKFDCATAHGTEPFYKVTEAWKACADAHYAATSNVAVLFP